MQKQLLRKYRDTQRKKKELELKMQELKDEIIDEMVNEGLEKQETTYGIFTLAYRTNYKYTDEVKKLEEKVKLAKVKEEQKGVADPSETQYLVFTTNNK